MVSEAQRLERMEKMATILRSMKHCSNIKEVAKETGIPRSTIQRYLNKPELYEELTESGFLKRENVEKALKFTRSWLDKAKATGLSEGGKTCQELYGYSKDYNGQFNGHSR